MSRTFYCRGQTGQQLLLGAYGALCRQVGLGRVKMFPRTEMLDLVVAGGRARGIVTRNLVTGIVEAHTADAVVLAAGGYANVFFLSTNARGANATSIWRSYRRGAGFANPCFIQVHPTCIPRSGDFQAKLTLISEALRNDGRVWVPKRRGDTRSPDAVPENERDYFLERMYPGYGNLAPRDLASRAAKRVCDHGCGVGPGGRGVYLDLTAAVAGLGEKVLCERYGNLFEIYERISGENPLHTPMRIYPAPHYTMGGLWVDYGLQSTIPGLFVLGEANFSDHGANRLGASALMQGLADGYFIIPYTLGEYFGGAALGEVSPSDRPFVEAAKEVEDRLARILAVQGKRTVDSFHRKLGAILWEHCGIIRNAAGLGAAVEKIRLLRAEFWENVLVPGDAADLNQELEKAGRVADYLELGELMCRDALAREESCGCHFREEFQTACGEALRDDRRFGHVAVWEHAEQEREPVRHVEPLTFETIIPAERSYK